MRPSTSPASSSLTLEDPSDDVTSIAYRLADLREQLHTEVALNARLTQSSQAHKTNSQTAKAQLQGEIDKNLALQASNQEPRSQLATTTGPDTALVTLNTETSRNFAMMAREKTELEGALLPLQRLVPGTISAVFPWSKAP